jgi:hypothetical protein
MLAILKTVLTEAVKVTNFIKSRATNSRLFSISCNEMGSEHDKFHHTEVRWLPRWNVLSRLLEILSEVQIFLSDTTSDVSNRFTDEMGLSRLAYVADIFCRLSELKNSLQGFRTTPFSAHEKQKLSEKAWFHYQRIIYNGQVSSFPFLDSFISENEIQLEAELAVNIKERCENLIPDFKEYFAENLTLEFWFRDPFSIEDILPESFNNKRERWTVRAFL